MAAAPPVVRRQRDGRPLLDSNFALAEKNTLYRCLDRLLEHKGDLLTFLLRRWGELFGAKFDVLLYDLTST